LAGIGPAEEARRVRLFFLFRPDEYFGLELEN